MRGVLLLAALASAVAMPAAAQSSNPIKIVSCQVITVPNGPTQKRASLWIDYRNLAKVAASKVTFYVVMREGGMSGNISDTGTFAPGAEIKHNLLSIPVKTDVNDFKPESCRPVSVAYVDGSSWSSP